MRPGPQATGPNPFLDSAVDMWATSPPRKLWSLPLAGRHPLALAFRPDGAECVVASRKGYVTTLDAATGDVKR
jgi:hypothetical protein